MDSLATSISDSTIQDTVSAVSTEETPLIKPVFKSDWIDVYGNLHYQIDSSAMSIYRFNDLLYQNYNDMGDLFRNSPLVQIYDPMEPGIPRFIGGFNLLPHQTAIKINGWTVNDPIHGMYNTRFCPADIVQAVERTPHQAFAAAPTSGLYNGINISTRKLNPAEPYSRIMFRQGDFGYTDLDLIFARQLGSRAMIQLSGINKMYNITDYKAQNYHAMLGYRLSAGIQSSIRININDEKAVSLNLSNYPSYKYSERREELYADITGFHKVDSVMSWKILTSVSSSDRTIESQRDTFYVQNKYDRYQFSIMKNISLPGKLLLRNNLSADNTIVWGNAFGREHKQTVFNGWTTLDIPVHCLMISPDLQACYLSDQDLKISPGVRVEFASGTTNLSLSTREQYRTPDKTEQFLQVENKSGNKQIKPERIRNIVFNSDFRILDNLFFNVEARVEEIHDEIKLVGSKFQNDDGRDFKVIGISSDYSFYKFRLKAGGQKSFADIHLSPEKSAWAQIRYTDLWLKGAIKFDAVAGVNWTGSHNEIYYDPVVQRYSWSESTISGYQLYYFKLVATIKDAELFMVMDNPLSYEYEYIKGYNQYYRRVQFGLNWVLWD